MAESTAPAAGILLVVAQREDRRALFNVLDSHGFSNIYTACDVSQARALLTGRPQLDVVLMEFRERAAEAREFCAWLRQQVPEYGHTRILALVADDPAKSLPNDADTPRGVVGWLSVPIDAQAALRRVRALLPDVGVSSTAESQAPVADESLPDTEDAGYRFAFEGDDREWLVSTPEGLVLEVNAAFAEHTGLAAEAVRGRPLAELLGEHEGPAGFDTPGPGQSIERVLRRPRRDGHGDLMRASTRAIMRNGREVHVTVLREHAPTSHARAMLNLLAHLHVVDRGDSGQRDAAHLLLASLPLDFIAVCAALPEAGRAAQVQVAEYRESWQRPEYPDDFGDEPVVRAVLDGETVLHSRDADRTHGADGFLATMGFAAFAGLPLVDERNNIIGALLAGSGRAWDSHELVAETLRVASGHFARGIEMQRVRQRGRERALLDGLTQLPNRLLFNDRLDNALREARRSSEMFAVLFVDLDHFKSINDSLGHAVGDEVLKEVAERLRGAVRSSDTVARYAGDEFTLILRHLTQRDAVSRAAEKIIRLMDAPVLLADDSEMHVTASIGISFHPDDAVTAERLLEYADAAMYAAKSQGRNGYRVHVAAPEKAHRQRVELEARLREAQANDELRLHFQPQVDANSEELVGMEALVRWEHPDLGVISPDLFMPMADETGLLAGIGEWVLRAACETTAKWQRYHGLPLRVGVNLSAVQLMQPNLLEVVASVLQTNELNPETLELEVAESVSVEAIPNLRQRLRALRDLGCRLAIDDFGMGQCTAEYLETLPVDCIKIDQSFVRNIGLDADDEAVVIAAIDTAHKLHRSAVAEGVETEAQREFLCAHGCDELQGYLFCRPLAEDRFDTLLGQRQSLLRAGNA